MRASGATPLRSSLASRPEAKTRLPARLVVTSARLALPLSIGRRGWRAARGLHAQRCSGAEARDRLIAGDDVGAVILAHEVERILMRVAMRRRHRVRNDVDLIVEVERVDHRVLDAGFGPGAGHVNALDVELAQNRIQ